MPAQCLALLGELWQRRQESVIAKDIESCPGRRKASVQYHFGCTRDLGRRLASRRGWNRGLLPCCGGGGMRRRPRRLRPCVARCWLKPKLVEITLLEHLSIRHTIEALPHRPRHRLRSPVSLAARSCEFHYDLFGHRLNRRRRDPSLSGLATLRACGVDLQTMHRIGLQVILRPVQ